MYYPITIDEKFVNLLTYPQFFLLVKNFAYDIHAFKSFYSYSNNNSPTINTLTLPSFFAISPLCSETNINTNYDCLDYNINTISIENKLLPPNLFTTCSSVDNFSSPANTLAYTVRIKDDVFLIHKNCLLAERVTISAPVRTPAPPDDIATSRILDQLASAGISNGYQNEAFMLANYSDNKRETDYNTEYTIKIFGTRLCKFIVLSRPMFIKIGTSGLYKINYADRGIGNRITSYSSEQDEEGSLSLKIKRVCDKRIYPTNAANIAKALEILKYESSASIDCKPASIIDTNNSFLTNYINSSPATVPSPTPTNYFNVMLYYLTHSQFVVNNTPLTSCVSMLFKDMAFMSSETPIFTFANSQISTKYENETFTLKLANFGVSSEEIHLTNPAPNSVNFLCTWSNNKLNLALFYTKNNNIHLLFKSLETVASCSFIKSSLTQACIDQKCTVIPGQCCTFVSMHDIAISKNLL